MNMGTLHDWIAVAFMGMFWGGGMALMTGPRKAPDGSKTGWSWADGVAYALLGLFFGIGITFRWRALHPPFVFILLLAIGGAFAVVKLAPLKPPRIAKSPPIDKSPYHR
jgi:peptidoglycan/LPS O-acetylase OafA/YrhL